MSGNDLISRQAAIDAVEHITSSMSVCVNTDECHGMKRMQRQAVIELTNMPSAQKTQLSTEDTTFDCVSRREAIDAMRTCQTYLFDTHDPDKKISLEMAEFELEQLPSVQPERKRGHWIEVNDSYNRISGRCSICGWESHMYEDDVVGMNYCPKCGARMEVEHDNNEDD